MAYRYVIESSNIWTFSLLRIRGYLPGGYMFRMKKPNNVTIRLDSEMDYNTLTHLESMGRTSVRKIRTF